MQVMLERQQEHKLNGRIEMDDAYIGGEQEGKAGRGATHKNPFIAAVETDEKANPRKIHLRAVKGFRTNAIAAYARKSHSHRCCIRCTLHVWVAISIS